MCIYMCVCVSERYKGGRRIVYIVMMDGYKRAIVVSTYVCILWEWDGAENVMDDRHTLTHTHTTHLSSSKPTKIE